ncbi:hypothetical protein [Mucilaginibacter antarcticus]|uniref:hypothetical protein n=1 Tax=Mucilaginibacter antarcticus TaxID=1855725 RepID=UPI00363ACF5D
MSEERNLIDMLGEMLKIHLEQQERAIELRDYKFALDAAAIVSVSGVDGCYNFVNENFVKISKYDVNELRGAYHSIIWSGYHPPEYFDELRVAMQNGATFRGNFVTKQKMDLCIGSIRPLFRF